MNLNTVIASFAIVTTLSACAPVTVESIRTNDRSRFVMNVDADYKQVYQTILTNARTCYLDAPSRTQLILSDKRSNADKAGYIALKHVYGPTQEHTHWLADVKSTGENTTEVSAWYSSSPGSKKQASLVEQWVVKGSTACKA